MVWIESHTTLRTHKKLKPLCDDLNISRAQAIGHLHMLWWWTIENREFGDLNSLYPQDIANACDWRGEPSRLIRALKKNGWLTSDMKINDWMSYVGKLVKDRQRKRLGRVHGHSADASSATEPNRTVPNRTVKEKPGFFNENEEQIILKDIASKRNIDPNSESAHHRLKEICGEIGKIKCVDNALALARHKAMNQ